MLDTVFQATDLIRILGPVVLWLSNSVPVCLIELCICSVPMNLEATSNDYRNEQQREYVRVAVVQIGQPI